MSKQSNLINASQDITVNSSGNVGIGTSSLNSNKAVIEGGSAGTHSSTLKLSTGSSANSLVSDLAFYGTFVTPTADKGPRRTADITSGYSTANWGNEYLAFGVGNAGDAANLTTERMRIDGAGVITTPSQPLCSMNNGAGWLNMVANTAYGTGSSYSVNRGGFYAGLAIGGQGVTHVPVTGFYRVTLQAYVTNYQPGRLNLRANQSTLLCFLQIPSIPTHTALTENIVNLNAGDYLDYVTDVNMELYHSNYHTMVTLEFLG